MKSKKVSKETSKESIKTIEMLLDQNNSYAWKINALRRFVPRIKPSPKYNEALHTLRFLTRGNHLINKGLPQKYRLLLIKIAVRQIIYPIATYSP